MPSIQSTNLPLDGFQFNRKEMYLSTAEPTFDSNRQEVSPPNVQTNIPISQVNQVLQEKSIDLSKTNIDTLSINQFIRGGALGYNTGTGWWLGHDGQAYKFFIGAAAGNKLTWDGTTLAITGTLTATSGVIGGWTINATTITGGNVTLDSTGNIRFGKTGFLDTTNAGLIMGLNGATPTFYIGTALDASYMKLTGGVYELVGTISGRSTLTIATSINASGNLITDVINGRLDSSAKQILADFNFGATNYAGAVNAGNVTWNTTTGAITGGSGVIVYRGGIIGVNSGVATFTLDAATGAATFAGTLSAPTGTLGALTVNGSLDVSTSGNIKSGQTAYNTGSGWFLEYNGGTPRLSIGDGTASNSLTWNGSTLSVNGRQFTSDPTYGDGSDGTVTIAAGTTTLTRDMFYDTLTVNGTLVTAGFRVFVKNTLTVNNGGIIDRSGNTGGNGGNGTGGGAGGTAGAAGTALSNGSIYGSLAGKIGVVGGTAGANGSNGTDGSNQTSSLGSAGVAGGDSDAGGHTGGTAGTVTAPNASVRNIANALLMLDTSVLTLYTGSGSSGSGASGSGGFVGVGTTGTGGGSGGSGSPGGMMLISARIIVINSGGIIRALGGNGGNGGAGGDATGTSSPGNGGGGGSGGSGGVIVYIYTSLTNNGSISVAGGTGGTGGAAGTGGAGGAAAGSNGNTGNTGTTYSLQLM